MLLLSFNIENESMILYPLCIQTTFHFISKTKGIFNNIATK